MFGQRRPGTIGLVGLQQLFAIGGALTLAGMLPEVVFWAQVLKALFHGWAHFVHIWLWPVAVFLFGWAFHLIKIELTPFWKDYLTIGLLFGLGFARHFVLVLRRVQEEAGADVNKGGTDVLIPFPIFMSAGLKWAPLVFAPLSVAVWPLTLVLFTGMMLTSRENWRFVVYGLISIFLPIIYLGFLIAFNELVLK